MGLSNEQIEKLLQLVASAEPDPLDCDGCYQHIAEFAEASLVSKEIPEALRAVEVHLQQCACCEEEHKALLEGLRALEE